MQKPVMPRSPWYGPCRFFDKAWEEYLAKLAKYKEFLERTNKRPKRLKRPLKKSTKDQS